MEYSRESIVQLLQEVCSCYLYLTISSDFQLGLFELFLDVN